MTPPDVVVVGDAVLDRDVEGTADRICPDAPVPVVQTTDEHTRPGGAALAALLAARWSSDVHLVTALADDPPGRELHRLLDRHGVAVHDMGMRGRTAEKVRIVATGQCLLRVDRGGDDGRPVSLDEGARTALREAAAILVADYGQGATSFEPLRELIAEVARRRPVVWDPHPRGAAPVTGVRLVTPNESESILLVGPGEERNWRDTSSRAATLAGRWGTAVCVTLGAKGALLAGADGVPFVIPAPAIEQAADCCGAGDAFAVTAALTLGGGAVMTEAVMAAVARASSFVAGGGASAVGGSSAVERRGDGAQHWPRASTSSRLVRVVAGGCFDLLHTGHVALLEAASRLGDELVVCLNSDDSVRRLKGPGRPVVPAEERAAVLAALSCVDAVHVFDEDRPDAILRGLRPDVFVKGGDYGVSELPEASVLSEWGGVAVILPYVEGRSSTAVIRAAAVASGHE